MSIVDQLSDLDLIAVAIHRLGWTGSASLVNMGTVAVVEVENELWYAVNVLQEPTPTEIEAAYRFIQLRERTIPITPYLVYLDDGEGDDKKTHAEMKLLYQLVAENKVTEGLEMGISKPACRYCYQTLVKNGIRVSWTHERQVQSWEYPEIDQSRLPSLGL